LKTEHGNLIVPIREILYINITDSFISDDNWCSDQTYLEPCPPSTPCPVCPSQTPLPSPSETPFPTSTPTPTPSTTPGDLIVNLDIDVMSGSVICNYKMFLKEGDYRTHFLLKEICLGLNKMIFMVKFSK